MPSSLVICKRGLVISEIFSTGDCLITAATGNLGDVVADRAGLVPTHAYAVLDIRKLKVRHFL